MGGQCRFDGDRPSCPRWPIVKMLPGTVLFFVALWIALALVGCRTNTVDEVSQVATSGSVSTTSGRPLPNSLAVVAEADAVTPGAYQLVFDKERDVLWLAGWESGVLLKVDAGSLEVSAELNLSGPHSLRGLAAGDDRLWLADFSEQVLLEVDPDSLAVVGEHRATLQYEPVFDGSHIWVFCCGPDTANGVGLLQRFDTKTGEVLERRIPDSGPIDLLVSGSNVWLLSIVPPKAIALDTSTLEITKTLELDGAPTHFALGTMGRLWVAMGNVVVGLEGAERISRAGLSASVSALAASRSGWAVAGTEDGEVALLSYADRPVRATASVGAAVAALVVDENRVFVVSVDGSVTVFDVA